MSTTAAKEKPATFVLTGLVRFSYAKVFKAEAINGEGTPKYSVSLLIPKSDKETVNKINAAINAAKEAGKADKFSGKIPAALKIPLRDGDAERPDDEAYKNCYFINANSTNKPQVVDKSKQEIIDQDDFYSGCYGRASVNFYAFNTNGNKGIAAGLGNVQKLKDGEPLSGRSTAEEDFASDFEDDDIL